jgi:hypothetical protein
MNNHLVIASEARQSTVPSHTPSQKLNPQCAKMDRHAPLAMTGS